MRQRGGKKEKNNYVRTRILNGFGLTTWSAVTASWTVCRGDRMVAIVVRLRGGALGDGCATLDTGDLGAGEECGEVVAWCGLFNTGSASSVYGGCVGSRKREQEPNVDSNEEEISIQKKNRSRCWVAEQTDVKQ